MANLQQTQSQNNPAFIIGNGISRKGVDLSALNNYGSIYGCNALYREFTPAHLIAVDAKMVVEIVESGYHKSNSVWTNPNKSITGISNINYLNPHKGWSSGPTALWLAVEHGFTDIYILGFDFEGINGKFNNMYADTKNYKKSTEIATFYGNWINQTSTVIRTNKRVNFTRVVPDSDTKLYPTLPYEYPNFKQITYSEFQNKYPYQPFS